MSSCGGDPVDETTAERLRAVCGLTAAAQLWGGFVLKLQGGKVKPKACVCMHLTHTQQMLVEKLVVFYTHTPTHPLQQI